MNEGVSGRPESGGRSATSGSDGLRVRRVVVSGSMVGSDQLKPACLVATIVVSSNVGIVGWTPIACGDNLYETPADAPACDDVLARSRACRWMGRR